MGSLGALAADLEPAWQKVTCQSSASQTSCVHTCKKSDDVNALFSNIQVLLSFHSFWGNVSSDTAKIILAIFGEQHTMQDYF